MVAKTKVCERPEMNLREAAYLYEIGRGFAVTTRQLFKNLFRGKRKADVATIEYPEVKRPYPDRFRGVHRLMKREDGQVRCVACMLCQTACPADCITIEPGAHDDPTIEKFPQSFDIDLMLCVFCGLCVEACPCDAIRMDTGKHPMPSFSRDKQRIAKAQLMEDGSLSVAAQGGRHAE